MISAPQPDNEEERLQKLYELNILDTLEEPAFDDITHLAAQICEVPIALISLIDRDRQFLKSHFGLDVNEVSRELGFCPHAILDDELTIVEDTSKDERFYDNPFVTGGPRFKFYAGAPLVFSDNIRLGTLCVVDHTTRKITSNQQKALEALARQVVSQLELRQTVNELEISNKHRSEVLTKLKRSEARERYRSIILEKLAQGSPLVEILETLAFSIENEFKDALCSIHLIDDERQHLVNCVAPNLPKFYIDAMNNIKIGLGIGSCGMAAHSGKRVIVEDIQNHPYWDMHKELAGKAGLAACWSEPILDSEGKVLGIVCIYHTTPCVPVERGISLIKYAANLAGIAIQRKHEEQAIITARVEAERANAAKSQFLSRMSHELRTPLNAILGFAQLLEIGQGEISPEIQKDHVEHILNSGWHLLNLVDDVLDLAKIEANRLELSMDTLNTDIIIRECMDTMLPLALDRNITLEHTENVNCEGCAVKADILRLRQVLLNLLSNAVKYNHEGGSVTVTCQETDSGYARITVTDTGSGITKEDQASLFEPFSRLYLKTYARQGTGIGLSISKLLVELMGGSIGIESQSGKGSTFWVELELSQQTESECEAKAPVVHIARDQASTEQHHTLLYIEDSPSHVKLLGAIVENMSNISLLTAHTPQLGLELATVHKPDLIILDICLPGMDGYEVLSKLQEHETLHHTPVVAMSANAMSHEINKGLHAGFRRYLTKPINVNEFKKALNELLLDSVV